MDLALLPLRQPFAFGRARRSSPTVPVPKRTSNKADSFCWIAKTWMRRSAGQRRFRRRRWARSRSGRFGHRMPDISHQMSATTQIEKTFREEHGRVLAALISQLGNFMLAEDALQDALVNALERWDKEGVPRNPG